MTFLVQISRILRWALRGGLRPELANPGGVAPVLYTIGYERHPEPDSLVAVLQAAGVKRLLDVRELPLSRRRGFSKTALGGRLSQAGVLYEHERALGNPKAYRDLYRSGNRDAGERRYRTHLRNGVSWAVDELAVSLKEATTCLLCFEHEPVDCHRAVIVEALLERIPSLRVEHL